LEGAVFDFSFQQTHAQYQLRLSVQLFSQS
jgi:hypothetical protein